MDSIGGDVSEGGGGARDLIAVELDYPLKDAPSSIIEFGKRYGVNEYELRVMLERQTAKLNPRNRVRIIGSCNGLVCISPGWMLKR